MNRPFPVFNIYHDVRRHPLDRNQIATAFHKRRAPLQWSFLGDELPEITRHDHHLEECALVTPGLGVDRSKSKTNLIAN